MNASEATALIQEARSPTDLFGELTGSPDEQLKQARAVYLQLAKFTHPDAAGDSDAFAKLAEFWSRATNLIETGSYNEGGLTSLTVKTKRGVAYTIGGKIAVGEIADVHRCGDGVIKIARNTRDNDLLKNEASIVKEVREEAPDEYAIYLPELTDTFGVQDQKRYRRQANVFAPLHVGVDADRGKWVTLAHIHRKIPAVHPKDMAWLWRRILTAVSLAHDVGFVHHAVLPDNILVLPPEHGVVLIDWCYARPFDKPPIAVSRQYRSWHPQEVNAKEPSVPETDLFMAAKTMIQLLGGNPDTGLLPNTVPRAIRAHLRACTFPNPTVRPGSALGALNSFNEIIEKLWGKRTFHELVVPA